MLCRRHNHCCGRGAQLSSTLAGCAFASFRGACSVHLLHLWRSDSSRIRKRCGEFGCMILIGRVSSARVDHLGPAPVPLGHNQRRLQRVLLFIRFRQISMWLGQSSTASATGHHSTHQVVPERSLRAATLIDLSPLLSSRRIRDGERRLIRMVCWVVLGRCLELH